MKTRLQKHPQTTLGVVAISLNEEQDLPGFLDNLRGWVDQIVIVDEGSSDRTGAIAAEAGPTVDFIHHPRVPDAGFAGQRNAGLAAIRTDWVLNMDIDERVTPELQEEILREIKYTRLNAFRYRRENYFLHRPMQAGGWNRWNRPQLARRGCHHYEGIVHEACIAEGGETAIGQLRSVMAHLNDASYSERMRKSAQYSHLEAEKLQAQGRRVSGGRLLFEPVLEFFKKYVLRQGFRDGVPGLIAAMHSACARFQIHALVWDEQNRIPREALEKRFNLSEGDDTHA